MIDDSVKLRRLQKELAELKEKQRDVGVSDEELQKLESDRHELQEHLAALLEEKEIQRVSHWM